MDPSDLALLVSPVEKQTEARGPTPIVPWLRRTEYISTERHSFGRARVEQKYFGDDLIPRIEETLEPTDAELLVMIERSFESAVNANLSTLKHPQHKHLVAQEIFPIFPDFHNWANDYFLATYDENPLGDKQGVLRYAENLA